MKKTTLTKVVVSLSMIGAISLVNAQWAVTNVDDVAYFGPTGIFTEAMGQMSNSVKGAVDAVRATQGVQIQQQNNNQNDTDTRNRVALGMADMSKYNLETMPTIQQCIQLTASQVSSGGISAAMSSTTGGGIAGTALDKNALPNNQKTAAQVTSTILAQKSSLGTCTTEFDSGLANCSGDGAFAGADLNAIGIKANVANKQSGADFSNWTMDQKAYNVAMQYANNATLANAPKYIPPANLKNNASYMALYQQVMDKLWAAHDSLVDIAKIRRGPTSGLSGAAQQVWSTYSADYSAIFPNLTPPTNGPSLFDFINLRVFDDFQGKTATQNMDNNDATSLARTTNERLALANMIAWRQAQLMEDNNILLAHMLVQQTTPMSKGALETEQNASTTVKQ
jgi:hypothetical protein